MFPSRSQRTAGPPIYIVDDGDECIKRGTGS